MSHRDCVCLNSSSLRAALNWLAAGIDWSSIRLRADCTWTPRLLATTALLWAWSDEGTLADRFWAVRRIVLHLFTPATESARTYQAFTKLLRRWTAELVGLLQRALRERMQQGTGRLLAGRRVCDVRRRWEPGRTTPDAVSRRGVFVRASNTSFPQGTPRPKERGKARQEIELPAVVAHDDVACRHGVALGLADRSCRQQRTRHWLEMLPALPPGALMAVDAGFVGYEYTRAVLDSQRHVLLRVGSNVRLLKKLGFARERANTVYLWPDREAKRREPPLVLRLVVAHTGRHPVFLVTSVLSTRDLTDQQVVELYARRWGIELFYRHLKQTFQRRKLRSARAENALFEMEWSLAGLWAMALVCAHREPRSGSSPAAAEHCRHVACVPPGAARLLASARTGSRLMRRPEKSSGRRLPPRTKNQPRLSSQKTRTSSRSAPNPQRFASATSLGKTTSQPNDPKGLTA